MNCKLNIRNFNLFNKEFFFAFIVLLATFQLFYINSAKADSIVLSPVIIDDKARARDILKHSITLVNNADYKLNLYTFVNNILSEEGKQEFSDPSKADQTSSLANWIAIRRGSIQLNPGEKKKINFEISVNLRAKAGIYHAAIAFVEGATRYEAETKLNGASSVTVNLEVVNKVTERLNIKKFAPGRTFFSGFPVSFSYEFENIGDSPETPSGEIRIYNRSGEELTALKINENGLAVEPGTILKLANFWPGVQNDAFNAKVASIRQGSGGFGRYKAILVLEYGDNHSKVVQDTVFFWIMPWLEILIIFTISAFLIIALTYLIHRRYLKYDEESAN